MERHNQQRLTKNLGLEVGSGGGVKDMRTLQVWGGMARCRNFVTGRK